LAITLLSAGLTLTLGEFRYAPSAAGAPAGAGEAETTVARRIRVPLPITGSSDLVIKQIVQRTLEQLPPSDERPLILFEFWAPSGSEGSGSEFERSLSLARYLTSPALKGVRTAAYIPRIVTGHAVLPVLACEQIIMSPDAILGDAGKGETGIGPTMRGGYTEIARSRLTVPEAIALGMLDADLQVYRVTTGSGVIYTWEEELQRLRESRDDLLQIDTLIPAGRLGRFRGDELRQMGFVSYLVDDDRELASVLKVPADQLEFDPSLGGEWRAIRVELSGPVIGSNVERVMRTIEQQRNSREVNFLCLEIDSPGGSVLESMRLANYLSDLDDSRIRTVAYVPREARADAMIVAFACDHLVTHADAVLGGGGAMKISPDELDALREPLERIARQKNRQWSLIMAMLDPDLAVYRYTQAGTDRVRYLSEPEFEALAAEVGLQEAAADDGQAAVGEEGPQAAGAVHTETEWIRGEQITTPGQVVQVDGKQAEALGVARFLVENFAQFQQLYSLPESPELIGPNWAFDLIDALASPQLGGILLFIGGFALIAELSSPGLGVGGFISAVCFLLYFWSNFLHGTAELLEVMLFVAGLAFVAIEIFVLPGFGVFGLGGGALMFAALVLASQTFVLPRNEYQWHQLSRSMLSVALAGTGVFASLLVLRRYLHRMPIFGRIMLMPPAGEDLGDLQRREALVDYTHLVGQVGITRTQLTPSGKAVFGDRVVDVITDGEVVAKGSAVEVVEAHGSRVIVRPHEA
jgi:membrane-bound ClpP family serine protease